MIIDNENFLVTLRTALNLLQVHTSRLEDDHIANHRRGLGELPARERVAHGLLERARAALLDAHQLGRDGFDLLVDAESRRER